MYALVYKGRVINGPRDWNKYQFEGALEKEGINFQVGRAAPPEAQIPIVINADAKILYARYEYPVYNERTQSIDGPYWEFTNTEAIGTFTVGYQPIEYIRLNLKAAVKENRKIRENKIIILTVNNTQVEVSTDRETRAEFVSKLVSCSNVPNATHNYKFRNDVWVTIGCAEIQYILEQIDHEVQDEFDWELAKVAEIDAAQTPQELEAIDVGDSVVV